MKIQNKQLLRISFFILSLCYSASSKAEAYSWSDTNGQTHFTISPVATKSNINTKRVDTQKTIIATFDNNSPLNQARYNDKNHSMITSKLTANSQCRKVSKKMPKIYSLIRGKIEKSVANGRMSQFQYDRAIKQMIASQKKQPSFADCITKYNSGDTSEINQIANNDTNKVFAYFLTKSRKNFNKLDNQFTNK